MLPAPEEGCRPATATDLPRLAELAAAAVADQQDGRGGAVWARQAARRPPFLDALEVELAAPDHHVLVGTLDETVMAYAVA
ncbi:MAG: hypothetical protein ABL966_15935, partial [Acidimicrobiales bacterium]